MKHQMPQISWHGRNPVLSIDFQPLQGELRRIATGGTDAHVVIWYVDLCPKNIVTIECACDLNRHNKSVNVVRFSPNGVYLASGDDEGSIFIWKLREKTVPDLDGEENDGNKEDWYPFKLLRGHLDDISDLNWSPDSDYLISGSIDNTVVIWDIQKGQNIRLYKEAKSFVQGVAWDPLGQFHASISSDRMLRIYNASSGKVVHKIYKLPSAETADKTPGKSGRLFHDDTLQSFCRRLTFSPDGELLFVPSGIREKGDQVVHTTYVFSRYELAKPVLHMPSLQKYTLAVRCCPVFFKLSEVKNKSIKPMINLPYRVLIAVATQDSILFYDTQQLSPFAFVSNVHYTHLTDLAWSPDGRMLIVSSTDGYCSFIIFGEGELGEVYVPEKQEKNQIADVASIKNSPNEKCVSKSKSEAPISAEEIIVDNAVKELSPIQGTAKSPNPEKLKTPLIKTPVFAKKTPKLCSIKSFFSPPDKAKTKKSEPSDDADCIIVEDKKVTNGVAPTVTCKVPTAIIVTAADHKDIEKTQPKIEDILVNKEKCLLKTQQKHIQDNNILNSSKAGDTNLDEEKMEVDIDENDCKVIAIKDNTSMNVSSRNVGGFDEHIVVSPDVKVILDIVKDNLENVPETIDLNNLEGKEVEYEPPVKTAKLQSSSNKDEVEVIESSGLLTLLKSPDLQNTFPALVECDLKKNATPSPHLCVESMTPIAKSTSTMSSEIPSTVPSSEIAASSLPSEITLIASTSEGTSSASTCVVAKTTKAACNESKPKKRIQLVTISNKLSSK